MKSVTKYISIALILAAGLFSSCRKDLTFSDSATDNQITVIATIANEGTKVAFDEEGTALKASWEATDNIVGWDEDGNAIELEVHKVDNGVAIFKPVSGSAAIPTSGKVYMIYALGKHHSNISNKSLEYDLSNQNLTKVPALMTATGEVTGNVLSLSFRNELAIVAVKNPKFSVTAATTFSGLKISGSNINTMATFGSDDNGITVSPSAPGDITRSCTVESNSSGNTTATVYFAVLPNSTAADVKVSTVDPVGYQIACTGKSFEAGKCYLLNEKTFEKSTFTITKATCSNGSFTTSPEGSCEEGQTVTVIPDADEDYVVDKVTYNDGTEHDITATRTFTMPKKDVTVNITYRYALLNGVFTVAADDGNGQPKKVKFTNGNLKWTNNEWNIESSQESYSREGYFYWSEDAAKAHSYKLNDPDASADDKLFCHEDTPLTIFGADGLFALSSSEWEYLVKTRDEVNRFACANVNGKPGILIFPDGYSETQVSGTGIGSVNNINSLTYPNEQIETNAWGQMQSAGVVFLPQTYFLNNGLVNTGGGLRGYYWSSTPSSNINAYYLFFLGYMYVNNDERSYGYPIRLVKMLPAMAN